MRKLTNLKLKLINDAEQSGKMSISEDDVKRSQELFRSIEKQFAALAKEMSDKKQKDLLNK